METLFLTPENTDFYLSQSKLALNIDAYGQIVLVDIAFGEKIFRFEDTWYRKISGL